VKRRKQRDDVIVPTHCKMAASANHHQNDGGNDSRDQATWKMARRSGALRMISPPRALFSRIWLLIHPAAP
jgi:hypothetical protein